MATSLTNRTESSGMYMHVRLDTPGYVPHLFVCSNHTHRDQNEQPQGKHFLKIKPNHHCPEASVPRVGRVVRPSRENE